LGEKIPYVQKEKGKAGRGMERNSMSEVIGPRVNGRETSGRFPRLLRGRPGILLHLLHEKKEIRRIIAAITMQRNCAYEWGGNGRVFVFVWSRTRDKRGGPGRVMFGHRGFKSASLYWGGRITSGRESL